MSLQTGMVYISINNLPAIKSFSFDIEPVKLRYETLICRFTIHMFNKKDAKPTTLITFIRLYTYIRICYKIIVRIDEFYKSFF